MKKLAQRHPEGLLDLLTERLAFERTGVKLYETVLSKTRRSKNPIFLSLMAQMKVQRDEEKEHEEWLESVISALGGDASMESDLSDLVERESSGLIEVIATDDEISHLFHALLTAELIDESGWRLLVDLADAADDFEARRELRKRAMQEEEHLLFIRSVVGALTRREVLGAHAMI